MIEELGISKRLFRFLIFLLVIDLAFAVLFNYSRKEELGGGMAWFFHLSFPLWVSVSGGSILGVFLMLLPQKGPSLQLKLLRSMLLGTFALAAVFFILYFYQLLLVAYS